jgi:hypothetical protein
MTYMQRETDCLPSSVAHSPIWLLDYNVKKLRLDVPFGRRDEQRIARADWKWFEEERGRIPPG